MSWGEAYRLTEQLIKDPTSHVSAAMAGWDYPISFEALVTADLFDVTASVHSPANKKPDPWPRPWKQKGSREKKRLGTPVSIAKFRRMWSRARDAQTSEEVNLWQER